MQRILTSAVRAGVTAITVLACAGCSQPGPAPIRVLMITGGEGHDYETLSPRLAERLAGRGDVAVEVTGDLAGLDDARLASHDVLFFNVCTQEELGDAARRAITEHVRSGRGLVAMHGSLASFRAWPEWIDMLGGAASVHAEPGTCPVTVLDPAHAAMLGMGRRFTVTDQTYLIDRHDPNLDLLIRTTDNLKDSRGQSRGQPEPLVWTRRCGDGRVFVVALGHDKQAQCDERFISLMHNGIRWASGRLRDTEHNVLTKSERQVGFELLFNGRDLAGWTGDVRNWSVENGQLVGRAKDLSHNVFLTHQKQFGDFLMRFSVKVISGNSGVQYRSEQFPDCVVKGYQADAADEWWGCLYDEGTGRGLLAEACKEKVAQVVSFGGWNDMTVKAVGPKMTITLNGLTTVEYVEADNTRPTRGVIALQLHRGPPMEVRYRDIRIRPLTD